MQYFNKPKQVNIQDVFIRLSHFRLTPYIHRGVRSDDSIFLGIQPIECFENKYLWATLATCMLPTVALAQLAISMLLEQRDNLPSILLGDDIEVIGS